MFRSILVPIDIAHRSSWEFALPQAIELATAARGHLQVITVIRDIEAMFEGVYLSLQLERMIGDAHKGLAEIVSQHQHGELQIHLRVRVGSIAREILRAASDTEADLILMASHRPKIRDYVIGPHSAFVAQHAACSVLILRRFAPG